MANFIVNGIYQGGSLTLDRIPREIVSIVNLEWPIDQRYAIPSHIQQILYMGIPDGGWPGNKWIHSIVNIIDNLLRLGPVYVHCFAGISRSCMVVVAYLMIHLRMTFDQAIEQIKHCNSECDMNEDFIEGLIELERVNHV